jgi:hypothetical protein
MLEPTDRGAQNGDGAPMPVTARIAVPAPRQSELSASAAEWQRAASEARKPAIYAGFRLYRGDWI